VFAKDKEATRDKNMENIEHALKVLKVLWFVHRSANLLTEQGINFLLHKSVTEQAIRKQNYDDTELIHVATHQLKPSLFRHPKIDDNMIKSI
jgi:hypothetical protein